MLDSAGLLSSALAFVISVSLIEGLRRLAPRWRLVDHPNTRKRHRRPVPAIGGLAMFGGISVGCSLLPLGLSHCTLLLALLLLIGVGLWDDRHSLPTPWRFLMQAGAALLMVWGGAVLHDLGNLVGQNNLALHAWSIPLTVFCAIGVINALNMADGLDGLAGGISLIAVLWLLVLALDSGQHGATAALLSVLAAALIGFLSYNLRHPWRAQASIFMGDAGSMMLGGALAWAFITLSQDAGRALTPITAVWILGLPLIDTVSLMIQRILSGHSPFAADRQHLHHILLEAGLGEARATALLLTNSLLFGAVGVLGFYWDAPQPVMFYAFLALFSVYFFSLYGRRRRALRPKRHGSATIPSAF